MRAYHPGFLAPINVERTFLSDDPDTAVAQTISQMARYVVSDSQSGSVVMLANQLRGRTSEQTISNVWYWIKARVRFVQDRTLAAPVTDSPNIAEVLIRPIDILRMADAQGDCDDFSMLGAALFLAAGVPVYFVTLAADPRAPEQFSHVYLQVAGRAFDCSHGLHVGWEAPNRFGRKQLWSVTTGMPVQRRALAGLGDNGDFAGETNFPADTSILDVMTPPTDVLSTLPNGGLLSTSSVASTSPWAAILSNSIKSTMSILQARLGVPPPGTVITTRNGSIATGVQPGAVALSPMGGAFSGSSWIWIAGLAVVALVVISASKGGRR